MRTTMMIREQQYEELLTALDDQVFYSSAPLVFFFLKFFHPVSLSLQFASQLLVIQNALSQPYLSKKKFFGICLSCCPPPFRILDFSFYKSKDRETDGERDRYSTLKMKCCHGQAKA